MSLFGKLLGRRSADEERQRADELHARGELGPAKLAYESALARAQGEPEAVQKQLAAKIDLCRDGLARARIAEGDTLLTSGARELAIAEFQGAAEVAASAEVVAEAERKIEALDRREAREQATVAEQSEEDRYETIAGSFEEYQYEEYAERGPELRTALLALYGGAAAQARPVIERLLAENDDARYLWFECGRARLLDGEVAGGREALQRFLKLLDEGEGGEARLVAHMELAALQDEAGDFDAAAAEYEAALDAMPDDPRPYLAMALFFRRAKLPAEAIEVLRAGQESLEESQRQWRFTLELGLAHADAGDEDSAVAYLEEVVSHFTARSHLDLPPDCAVRLAELHEKRDNKPRALDLYRLLAGGSDVANLFAYHSRAARLMAETGHTADARRMLTRAIELAPEDPEIRAELDRRLAELR